MSAEHFYRLLLRAYPPEFRAEYGGEMVLLFRDQCRESNVRSLGFWARVLCDVARSAPTLRMEAWCENNRTMEVTMKIAAILTGLLGVFGIANAAVEWVAGSKGANDGTYVLAVVLGVFASVLLLGAGVAILLQTRWGRQPARLALVVSVVLFVAARLLFPWMSYFSQLVGFGLPVALLIALYRPSKPSTFGAASIVLLLVFGLSVPAAVAQAKPGDTVKDLPLTAAQRQSLRVRAATQRPTTIRSPATSARTAMIVPSPEKRRSIKLMRPVKTSQIPSSSVPRFLFSFMEPLFL